MDVSKAMQDARRFAWWKKRQLRNKKPGKAAGRHFNWVMIGKGHFSQVFTNSNYPGIVLKLSCRGGALKHETQECIDQGGKYAQHDAWQPFAKMCMQNPAPNLPTIYAYEQLTPSYGIALMKEYSVYTGHHETLREAWRMWLDGEGHNPPSWLWPAIQLREMMNLCVDLHDANIMLDSNNTLILTDPFSVVNTSD